MSKRKTDKAPARADLPLQVRSAAVAPASVQAEARTVDVVWSTGATVRRYDWYRERYYDEALSLDPAHVDLSRMNGGANVLNAHGTWDLSDVLGVVQRGTAKIENGAGLATLQFSERADVQPIWQDVAAGIISNVSVGYQVRKYLIEEREGEVPLYRAVDWMPYEVSMVPVPADAGAQTRSAPRETFPCEFIRADAAHQPATQEESTMANENRAPTASEQALAEQNRAVDTKSAPDDTRASPSNQPAAADVRADATAAERARGIEIRKAVRAANLGDAFADDLVTRGVPLDQARGLIIDAMAERGNAADIRSSISAGDDQFDRALPSIEVALEHRMNPRGVQLTDDARQWRGLSLLELGRDMLQHRGAKVRGLDKMTLATRIFGMDTGMSRAGAMSTSDFPQVLANVAHRTMRRSYDASPQTFKPFTRQSNVSDFKPVTRVQISGAVKFLGVPEGGEFKRGALTDAAESYSIGTSGLILPFTRQALINDDLGAFNRLAEIMGRSAANYESDVVWSIITSNPAMGDGTAMFHADHDNLANAGAAVSVDSLDEGRAAMRKQKGLTSDEPINVAPRFILNPAAKETTVQKFLATNIFPTKGADVNPFAGSLTQITEPRLDAASTTAWYLVADPAGVDTIEYAYLDGQEGLYTESRVGFDVDGLEVKGRLDFGAAPIDWRGFWKNAGA
jgi:hypothetical protein